MIVYKLYRYTVGSCFSPTMDKTSLALSPCFSVEHRMQIPKNAELVLWCLEAHLASDGNIYVLCCLLNDTTELLLVFVLAITHRECHQCDLYCLYGAAWARPSRFVSPYKNNDTLTVRSQYVLTLKPFIEYYIKLFSSSMQA